jgi:hypothetical protein
MARMRRHFGAETGLAGTSLLLLLATLAWSEWIEFVFRVDPDRGNGSLEWLIVALLALATALFSARARTQWKQIQLAT